MSHALCTCEAGQFLLCVSMAHLCGAQYCYGISVHRFVRLFVTRWYCGKMTESIASQSVPLGSLGTVVF